MSAMADSPASSPVEPNLSVGRNLKIGLFHLGSGMADVMTTGVWNRIMISDLGFAATPIGLLIALRYFLAPLGVWAGRRSDARALFGFRRLSWIWLGRAMMVLSVVMLGIITSNVVRGFQTTALTWIVIGAGLLLFSLGNALSGSTFLALVYDRAGEPQRTRAVGIVWTFLLLGFTIGGIFFGVLLPSPEGGAGGPGYSAEQLEVLFLAAAAALAGLWFFSLLGEERRNAVPLSQQAQREGAAGSIRGDLRLAWSSRPTRMFFWFLALSMLFAFSQDLILEPFAGDVFGMSASVTTRFAAYWGTMSIIATVVFILLSRRLRWMTNAWMSAVGVGVLVLTFGLLALSALAGIRGLVTPALITLGIGLGIWNVGALGMMMDMSPLGKAGTFLGFWTLTVTFARGIGVAGGGVLRDVFLALGGGSFGLAYGMAFLIGAVGLGVSLWALSRVNLRAYHASQPAEPAAAEQVFAGGMD